uniref:Phenylalanine--tRNA ligase beta subunit, chloroplastic n=1 Tax=Chaetoceros pseudocurvisetus TaxID=426637 RepID=A0A8F5J9H8_9STRA|nr:phenylalanine-tRNA ligase beta subunit [Chaetoceros pseudocurvisetus]
MYTSLDWLNQLVNVKTIQLEDLIDQLTLGGFEVEETLEIDVNNKKRTILDISATANRADSLSIKGIAKEITALLNQPTFNSSYTNPNLEYQKLIKDVISLAEPTTDCSTFITISIENLTDFTIPQWVTEKLVCSKLEPSNTLLDFQTYVLIETGYPFEFYDLNKIQTLLQTSEFDISLTNAESNMTFTATNHVKYNLNTDICVVKANNYLLSIGGIIANQEVAYTPETTSLLIEGSIFSSKKIRQQSRVLGLRTDRSARYEKGLNNSYFLEALIRLIQLLRIKNPNLICKIHTASEVNKIIKPNLTLHYENVIEILGPVKINETNSSGNICASQITEYLKRLDFDFTFDQQKLEWSVTIPTARIDDLEREIDLIEEIGRLHGFNNFVTNLPNVNNIGQEDFSYQIRKKLTSCFLNEGLNELMQYSLVNEGTENTIPLINPLINDYSTLRTSLLPNLVKIVSENLKQGNGILEGFEYGHVFTGNFKSEYSEKEMVAGIFGGIKSKRQWDQSLQTLSWFEGKGKIEELFKKLNFEISWKPVTGSNYKTIVHPYRTAELYASNNQCLGVFGQIHPILAKTYNIPGDIFLFEFNVDIIKTEFQNRNLALYEPYSTYPKITKDLSFVVNQEISFDQIQTTLLENGSEYLKTIDLLDEYRGTTIPENQTSLCIQLTFQSIEKTLLTKEIDEILKNLQTVLQNKYQVTIRI